jgi:cyclophilin family peptidyl-prolyl cis-trans isomerase
MIQGGDPLGTGEGGPGFTIKDEYNKLRHDKAGTLAMARTVAPDSAGSQFYVTASPQPGLDGQRVPYVVFGYVVEGLDVVQKINAVPNSGGQEGRPFQKVTINKIRTERIK